MEEYYDPSKMFRVLWLCLFFASFTVNLASTSVPYLIEKFVEIPGDPEKTVEATSLGIGVITSLNNLSTMVGSFLGGLSGDRVGYKKTILLSLIILANGIFLFYVSQDVSMLFLASLIQYLGYYLAMPSFTALVADLTPSSSHGESYGIFNLSSMIPLIIGPLLGGFIATIYGLKTPFIISFLIILPSMIFSSLVLKEKRKNDRSKVERKNSNESTYEANQVSEDSESLRFKRILILFSIAFAISGFANGAIVPLFNSYVMYNLKASPAEFGMISSLGLGLATALVQIPGGKLADKYGRKLLTILPTFVAFTIPLLAITTNVWHFMLILGIMVAIGNIGNPALSAWMMSSVPDSKRSSISGMASMARGIGAIAGPIFGSYLWNVAGVMSSFIVVSFFFLLPNLVYIRIEEK
ncbi:MAG: MFS transporter [Candidatus Asgardarchaeia archaeon]